ncbi:cytochrome b [Agrobacterium rosae]|uniref:Cytochrome b/b6 domain-containing protein n=1 Tax=Agrobacterium rosae TaxID=1972867 RepID=A0ABU4W5Q2_9HYPH|nr:cytochrome b/b6 domain-containing protein [Agrobacterium rosae]MDX8332786.1 cytochrome b/b6 domain-containing protein [Agrobacterium rosae]
MWLDTPRRYGLISRTLHWTMAYLLIWQFVVILTWRLFGDREWVRTVTLLGPGHGTVGLLVIVLVVIRAIWWTVNRNRRPVQSTTTAGHAAVVVHASAYLLMFGIPTLALLRAYGSGKGWEPWIPASGVEVSWMMAPADRLHSLLAWGLSVLIAGHVTMALVHRFALNDQTLGRMAGRLGRATTDEEAMTCRPARRDLKAASRTKSGQLRLEALCNACQRPRGLSCSCCFG